MERFSCKTNCHCAFFVVGNFEDLFERRVVASYLMRNFIVLNPGSRVRVLLAVIFDYRDRVARMLVRNSLRYWIVFQGRFRKEGTTVRETD